MFGIDHDGHVKSENIFVQVRKSSVVDCSGLRVKIVPSGTRVGQGTEVSLRHRRVRRRRVFVCTSPSVVPTGPETGTGLLLSVDVST